MIIQYASNNNSWLPNFSGGYLGGLESGIQEDTKTITTQFPMVNELKLYGAGASTFTCPASPAWQDTTFTYGGGDCSPWASWDPNLNPPNGFDGTGQTWGGTPLKTVYTFGYCFMNRASLSGGQWLAGNFHDNRFMPLMASDSGDLPLAADSIYYSPGASSGASNPAASSDWVGIYHEPHLHRNDPNFIDSTGLAPCSLSSTATNIITPAPPSYPALGGGNVVFMNGNCQWFDFGDILPGVGAAPVQQQPMYSTPPNNGGIPSQYFFGRLPQSSGSKLN
jgi:hypothetical protein